MFTRRRRVLPPPPISPPTGTPETKQWDNRYEFSKTTSTTSQRRGLNTFRVRRGDIFPTRGIFLRRKTLKDAALRVYRSGRKLYRHRHCVGWKMRLVLDQKHLMHRILYHLLLPEALSLLSSPLLSHLVVTTPSASWWRSEQQLKPLAHTLVITPLL